MNILFKSVLFIEFLFQGYCQYVYLSAVMERKKSKVVTLSFFLISSCIEYIVYQTIYNPVLNIFIMPTLSLIICVICYNAHLLTKLIHSVMISGIFLVSEMIMIPLVNIVMNDNYIQTYQSTSEIIVSTLSKLFFFIVCMLIKQIAEKEIIKTKSIYLFLVPFFSIVVIYSMVYSLSSSTNALISNLVLLIASVSFMIINTVVFAIHESYVKASQETSRLKLSEQKDHLVYEHYKVLSNNYNNTRILVHDFKSHINVLRAIAKDGNQDEMIEYLDSLSSQEYFVGSKMITGNKILDIVLYQFLEKCKENSILFEVVHNSISFSFVDESDLCSMMTNLLNNAVEAAEKSTDKKIQIHLYKKSDKEMHFIDIINSCDRQPDIENGLPVTSKNNKELHGIGVKSIQKTVKKYCGDINCTYDAESHIFSVHINLCDNAGSKEI